MDTWTQTSPQTQGALGIHCCPLGEKVTVPALPGGEGHRQTPNVTPPSQRCSHSAGPWMCSLWEPRCIPRGCSRTDTEEFWGFPDLPGHPGCILGVSSSPGHPGCWAEASHGSRCSQGSFSSPRPDSTQGKQHWRQWGHPPLMGDQGNSPFPLGLSQIPKSDSAPGLRLCGKHIESIIPSFQPSLSKFGTSKAVLVLWVTQRPQPRCGCGQTPEQAGLPEVTVPPKTPARGMRI